MYRWLTKHGGERNTSELLCDVITDIPSASSEKAEPGSTCMELSTGKIYIRTFNNEWKEM